MTSNQKNTELNQRAARPSLVRYLTRREPRSLNSRARRLLAALRSEFEDFFGGWQSLTAWPDVASRLWGIDVEEEADKIIIRTEAPGFESIDFNLQIHNNRLELCACHSEASSQDGGRLGHKQALHRSVPLAPGMDSEHAGAHYRNGILTIVVAKTDLGKGRKIEVKK